MNMLRIPKVPTKPRSRRQRESHRAKLELTLEMPARRPVAEAESAQSNGKPDEPERGVAEVDFYI